MQLIRSLLFKRSVLWVALATLVFAPAVLNAADTLTNAPLVLEPIQNATIRTNALLTFGLDHVSVLQARVMGNPLWQYIAALIYVVLAFYASKLLDWLIHVQLRKLTQKTETKLDDLLLELLRGPVKVVAF